MKKACLLFICIFLFNCEKIENKQVIQFKDYKEWYFYYYNNTLLSKDFIAKNQNNQIIAKRDFLKLLKTGNYIPIKQEENKKVVYWLQKINDSTSDIAKTVIQLSEIELFNNSWENKKFPNFMFKDLDGNLYNNENTENKIIFLKTYFIGCQACNKEMPELNAFIEKNKNRKNYIFLSLSLDTNMKLKNFLKSKNYKYKFIPNQEDFIQNNLKTNIFPTHFIIKNGNVIKVFNTAQETIDFAKTM